MAKSLLSRRTFLEKCGSVSLAASCLGACRRAVGADGAAEASNGTPLEPTYLLPVPGGRVFGSLAAARSARLKPGDTVLIRNMAELAPAAIATPTPTRGRWHARRYRLSDGSAGTLLMVNDVAGDEGIAAVPPEFEVKLDLPGWWAVWLGVPKIDLRPCVAGRGGVDVALDGDPSCVCLQPECGTRGGRFMGPMDVEVMNYMRCAPLAGRTLRIRVPYGTFSSLPWGAVRASISSLRLVRLSDDQVRAYQADIADESTKRTIQVCDGFSHYWGYAEPDKGIDARMVQVWRDSDVKALFFQSPATGCVSWPSRVTTLLGEGAGEQDYAALRKGDRRAADYVRWAVDNKQEGMRILSDLCGKAGLEFHASLRMNLFWGDEPFGRFINGRFWHAHPELRKPGGRQLDYAKPAARKFIVDLLVELATGYRLDGVNLDFTRWPPIADPARHDFSVLTGFIREIRGAIDAVARRRKQTVMLSANVVDGFHAGTDLPGQKIDLEAWLKTGALDFVCVEAIDHGYYAALAHKYNTPYYAHQDNEPPKGWQSNPAWKDDHDPFPGEEHDAEPHMNNSLDPVELDKAVLAHYKAGADGVALVNNFLGWRSTGRLGHIDEMAARVRTGIPWGQEIGPRMELDA